MVKKRKGEASLQKDEDKRKANARRQREYRARLKETRAKGKP